MQLVAYIIPSQSHLIDIPIKHPVPVVSKRTQKEKTSWLNKEIVSFLDELMCPFDVAERVDLLDVAHRQGFAYRSTDCTAVFHLHSSRVR